ncbi:MAG: DUF5009 domain-containing protein [Bacteroidota bacterium]
MEKQQRLQSLDALRGFDMLFIMGGAAIVKALYILFPNGFFESLAKSMEHPQWNGLSHHDTIFPLFLFIAGISFPFSLAKQIDNGKSRSSIFKTVIRRGIVLTIMGILYNGFLNFDFANMRIASVLARIGLAWMFGALIYMNAGHKARIITVISILVGYWLLIGFITAPDAPPGTDPLSMQGSLVGYIDRLFLPGILLSGGIHDPEGILGLIPSIATALLGMLTGDYIRMQREGLTPQKKVVKMLIYGAALIVIGCIWSLVFPLNKNLWTSSFTCVVGGYSLIMFAIFYYIIDVKNHRNWSFFFVIIGMNSLTIYWVQLIMGYRHDIPDFFLAGITKMLPLTAQPLMSAIGYTATCWLFLYFLYRQKIFLKV